MADAIFYVDESGDLGWKFDAPYRNGGSSRYLTIATLVCPSEKKHLPKRLIVNLYKKYKWDPKTEKNGRKCPWLKNVPLHKKFLS